jgi:hypothetical protein
VPLAESLPIDAFNFNNPDVQQAVIEATTRFNENARTRHPLADAAFPFRVGLKVKSEKDAEFTDAPTSWSPDQRYLYVAVARGDEYRIALKNQSGRPVFMRLLVDGLNTLPDSQFLKPAPDGSATYEVAERSRVHPLAAAQFAPLVSARAWYLPSGKDYEVGGFFTAIKEADGLFRRFVVADANHSEAYAAGHQRDIGIITAAFFEAVDRRTIKMAPRPRYGTRLGKEGKTEVEIYSGDEVPGELISVVHLHYGIVPE